MESTLSTSTVSPIPNFYDSGIASIISSTDHFSRSQQYTHVASTSKYWATQNNQNLNIQSLMTHNSEDHQAIIKQSFRNEALVEESDVCCDLVKIEITDLEDSYPPNITIGALRRCNRQVLLPLWIMFQFVGWRSFGVTSVHSGHLGWKYLNITYTAVIIALTLFAYGYQVLVCQWHLNIQQDISEIVPITRLSTITTILPWNTSNFSSPTQDFSITTEMNNILLFNDSLAAIKVGNSRKFGCEHIVTTYIVPNILHFIAFWLGFFHFRCRQHEELFSLTEKVFLYCSQLPTCHIMQRKVIMKTRVYLLCAVLWIMLTISMHILFDLTFYTNLPTQIYSLNLGLMCLDAIGYISLSSVSAAVILNYAIHCEMIICFVEGVVSMLRERILHLNTAIKDINTVRNALSLLNGTTAHMTGLIFLLYCENCILGTSILILNQNNNTNVWVCRAIFVIHSLPALLFSLIQAGRVNSICRNFRRVALQLRAYSYQNYSQLELDSFLLFVVTNKFEAKLFSMAVRPGVLFALTVATCFSLLILIQTGVISSSILI